MARYDACLQHFYSRLKFTKNLSGISSECQTVWIQIWPDIDLNRNCLRRFSADTTCRQIVNEMLELKNTTKIISIDFLSEKFRGTVTLCLLVSSADDNLCKQFGTSSGRQDVGPDLDPNSLTLMVFENDFFRKR